MTGLERGAAAKPEDEIGEGGEGNHEMRRIVEAPDVKVAAAVVEWWDWESTRALYTYVRQVRRLAEIDRAMVQEEG